MAQHFLPRERRWYRDRRTWGMLQNGREVWSRTDYILWTDLRLFGNVAVRDPQHNSDHYMVLGCLPSASLTEQKRYLGGRKWWLVRPPEKPTWADQLFAALRRAVPKAQPREARLNACPYRGSWRAETLSSTSIHVSSEIQAFRLASRGCAFGTTLRRAAKS